jgi:toxin ParE1/3/4
MATPEFTRHALADLDSIWDYTLREWGEAQAETYTEGLYQTCQQIADGDAIIRPFSASSKVSGICRYEHHYIFFVQSEHKTVVIAVLHERMDMIARVKDRL